MTPADKVIEEMYAAFGRTPLGDRHGGMLAAYEAARRHVLEEAAGLADEQAAAWANTGRICADARSAEANVIAMKLRALAQPPAPRAPAVEAPRSLVCARTGRACETPSACAVGGMCGTPDGDRRG